MSPTNDSNSYIIAAKCHLQSSSNNLSDIRHYKTIGKPLFVSRGQYIAIGFTHGTGFPCNVSQRSQHSIDLSQIELVSPIGDDRPIHFNVERTQGAAISFNINPSPGNTIIMLFF